jgi:hypothetical protein
MAMPSNEERLATLESEVHSIQDNVGEIMLSLKALEKVAAQGGGFFQAVLLIGGLIGWICGVAAALYAVFHR